MDPATTQVAIGVAIGVGVFATVGIIRALLKWFARTVSVQVVDSIGDSLQKRWRTDINAALVKELAPIHAELKTNGGTSLKDQVSSISLRLGTIESQLEAARVRNK